MPRVPWIILMVSSVWTVSSVHIDVLYPETLRSQYPSGITAKADTRWQKPYGSYLFGKLQVQENDCLGFSEQADFVLARNTKCALATAFENELQTKPKIFGLSQEEVWKKLYNSALYIDSSIADILADSSDLILLNITFDLKPTQRPTWELTISSNVDAIHAYLNVMSSFRSEEVSLVAKVISSSEGHNPGEECVLNSSAGKPYEKATVLYCLAQETWIRKSYVPDVDSIVQQICSRESDLSDFGFDVEALDTCVDELMIKDSSTVTSPTLVINGLPYDGSVDQVKRALCASFSSPGEECSEFFCAPGCWIDLLSNDVCDAKCNNSLCDFDSGDCSICVDCTSDVERNLQFNTSTEQTTCTYQDPTTGRQVTQSGSCNSVPMWVVAIILVCIVGYFGTIA